MAGQLPDHPLRDLTYPRLNLNDHTLDHNLPSPKPQPESGCLRPPPTTNVGVLTALPPELLQEILSQLDLCSLMHFRQVNRSAVDLVNSLTQYKAINTHAPNALRGILSIETGRWITCRTLYEKLCTPGCEQCGDFGGYLYLLTCKRVCFLCFSRDKLYLPLSPRLVSWKFGLDRQIINTLPRMRVLLGTYSPNVRRVCAPSVLVDYESALHAGISHHGSLSAMQEYVTDMKVQKLHTYYNRVATVQQSGPSIRMQRPQILDPVDRLSGNPFRFVAIVHLLVHKRALLLLYPCPIPVHSPPAMAAHAPNILVLQASVDPETESEFRVLVDNKFVKYISIDPGVYGIDDMCFGPSLISLLPPLPPGDWNKGRISRELKTGDIYFSDISKTRLLGITKTWHPIQIDHLKLRDERKLRSNVYEVTHPGFSSTIIAKFARFEWEVHQLQAETAAYEWIEGQQVGPDFLGHLTEDGRVIGFLMSRITDCRHATPEDFPLCHSVLTRLHNDDELEAELHELQNQLRDASGRGGQVVESGPS
ncbi:hypothetical protein F4818DRAFT_450600 [Hypoxylon cercidicola]|nr:hypothetical protein F4818DRAFT_450600 [Hypoxylon cercidicola]